MDEEVTRDPREYLGIFRRRKFLIATVATVIGVLVLVVAAALPSIYRSSATILVQEQEIPPDLVRSTITSFADERIQVISQQIMTRAVLWDLVQKYALYPDRRDVESVDSIVERMRKDITLSTVTADVSDRASGRRVNATIAFRISFDSPDPAQAQAVTTELVSLYLNENVKARQRSVAETTAFLAEEAERLVSMIQDIEAKLAAFKRRNADRMPDSLGINQQIADRTESELVRIDRDIGSLQDRQLSLESQLAIVKPHLPAVVSGVGGERVESPEARLRTLQAQYASLSGTYSPDHPDMRRMRREIAALQAQAPQPASDAEAGRTLADLEAELARARERYSDGHPDVQKLRRSIAALKSQQQDATGSQRAGGGTSARSASDRPDNPAYITLVSQIESTKRELAALSGARDALRAKQRVTDARMLQIPEIEREYRELTRDYENAQTRYRDIRAKQMQAQVAQELERDRKAERFNLGEPANLPERPHWPKRPKLLLMGFVAAIGGGLGAGLLRDLLDRSIKGPLELARIARVPLLTPIPYIETRGERRRKRRLLLTGSTALIVCVVVALVLVHAFLRPLPALLAGFGHLTGWV